MSQHSQILLATYIDGIYWRSALEVMLYPTGCSFYRHFAYRRQYAGCNVTQTPEEVSTLPSGYVGMRFLDQQGMGTRPLYIPLRRIDKIVIRAGDEFYVSFRLGPYVQHEKRGQFLSFDLSEKLGNQYQADRDTLLARLPAEFAEELDKLPHTGSSSPDIWSRFLDDPNLAHAARDRLVNTCILQLVKVSARGSADTLAPSRLEKLGPGRRERWGYKLVAGRVYDFDLVHRTLSKPGVISEIGRIAYECTESPDRVRLSRSRIPQTGNYREEQVWIQPWVPEPAPTFLEWEPVLEGAEARRASERGSALSLRVPFLVAPIPWYKFIELLVIGVLFLLAGGYFFRSALICARATSTGLASVYTALGALSFPVGVNLVTKWFDRRFK